MSSKIGTNRPTFDLFSYELPHLIHDTHVYPRQSSNGSTVIVYGHETGLRVVWYGGKKFKPPAVAQKVNGHGKNDAMVIDLDSDDGAPEPPKKAEFEDNVDEVDPSNAYYGVLRHLDIPLGSAVLHLAVPHLAADLTDCAPSLLRSEIIIATACSDYAIRAVVLPLDPPDPSITDASNIGTQIIKLPLISSHQDLISGVALTFTSEGLEGDEGTHIEQDAQAPKWSFLVASTSPTGSGLLLVHQITVKDSKLGDAMLLRRASLRSPMMAATISFNPASPPAERHSDLLIAIPDAPCVKVYQVFPPRLRNRRGSNGTTNSGSTTRTSSSLMSAGKFLVTLLPEFNASRKDDQARRKRVLDAKWVSAGRAIIALLEGNEWGIWDLEASGPAGSDNIIRGQSNVTGVVGGGWTRFAVRGTGQTKSKTLKEKDKDLSRDLSEQQEQDASQRSFGTVCVAQSAAKRNDDSVIFSGVGEAQFISSIATYWKSRITGKGAMQPYDRPIILPSLRTGGEAVRCIATLPTFPNEARQSSFDTQVLPNFLVSTSTRLILHVNPLGEPDGAGQDEELDVNGASGDQSLLDTGDLDLEGVDRYLEVMQKSKAGSQMQQPARSEPRARPNFGSSIMSRDGDVDMGMNSPTPIKASRLSLAPKSSARNTPGRLFS